VLVQVEGVQDFLQVLAQRGVLATPGKAGHIRLCTHLGVGDEEIDTAIEAAAGLATHFLER
jgi:threonine aldolase